METLTPLRRWQSPDMSCPAVMTPEDRFGAGLPDNPARQIAQPEISSLPGNLAHVRLTQVNV